MNNYRVPSLGEFTQGFEFEVLRGRKGDSSGGFVSFDFENNTVNKVEHIRDEDFWVGVTVWWDRVPEVKSIKSGAVTYTYKELPQWDWHPWSEDGYIEGLIKDKKVRVKCQR